MFVQLTFTSEVIRTIGVLLMVMHSYTIHPPEFYLTGKGEPDSEKEKISPGAESLMRRFSCFGPTKGPFKYAIRLCADVPDNHDPTRIQVKKEPGHVFLILSKADTVSGNKPVYQVFGFYPRRPVSSILFKTVNCLILDNGDREYNAFLHKELTAGEFNKILDAAILFSRRKYNLNKYNCYDYALDVFNSLPGIEKLPVTHVKFPFILGHGGSPCGLYLDLRKLKENCSVWAPYIEIGLFQSPESCLID